MINVIEINGYRAVVKFAPEIEMFRGEFLGLNGGADFYADSVAGLHREGEISLRVFLDMCAKDGVDPVRHYSGKFQVRLDEKEHARLAEVAAARGVSLNAVVTEALAAV